MNKKLIVLSLILLIVIGVAVFFCFYKDSKSYNCKLECDYKKEQPTPKSSPVKESFTDQKFKLENPLYVSTDPNSPHYVPYIQPPGDRKAQEAAGSGLGTGGTFFPLQGNGAQIMMAHSNDDNKAVVSHKKGKIGGYPNYTGHTFNPWYLGQNDFGSHGKLSNSYLIDGANQRVANNGQKGTHCDDFWPQAEKDNKGFCMTANSGIAHCNIDRLDNLVKCQNGVKFLEYKNKPQWKRVMEKVKAE